MYGARAHYLRPRACFTERHDQFPTLGARVFLLHLHYAGIAGSNRSATLTHAVDIFLEYLS